MSSTCLKLKCILLVLFVPFIISCVNIGAKKDEKTLKSFVINSLGKKLNLPEKLICYSPFSNYILDSTNILNTELRIYTRLNASCPTCIEDIALWENTVTEFSNYNVPVIIICNSKDSFELIQYLHEIGEIRHFSYPIFFDINDEYLSNNCFMVENNHFETVLTDNELNILLLGNPLWSDKIKEMYLDEIFKHQ